MLKCYYYLLCDIFMPLLGQVQKIITILDHINFYFNFVFLRTRAFCRLEYRFSEMGAVQLSLCKGTGTKNTKRDPQNQRRQKWSETMGYGFKILVEGDYAAYTRPELKVERLSYEIPTPGAIEGMLKSVYWKPAIQYFVDKIVVFNPIQFMSIRRNEVKEKVSSLNLRGQMNGSDRDPCIYTSECRSQRSSVVLKDVKYGIAFHFEMTGLCSEDETEGEKKHYNIMKRRLENGQCFRQPCLGCSEFPVRKIQLVDAFPLDEIHPQVRALGDVDMGYMCYRMQFEDGGKPINRNCSDGPLQMDQMTFEEDGKQKTEDRASPLFSDRANAVYYRPHMVNGIIDIEKYRGDFIC